jgi:hypothetical protein
MRSRAGEAAELNRQGDFPEAERVLLVCGMKDPSQLFSPDVEGKARKRLEKDRFRRCESRPNEYDHPS